MFVAIHSRRFLFHASVMKSSQRILKGSSANLVLSRGYAVVPWFGDFYHEPSLK